jgi:hypothetical protein
VSLPRSFTTIAPRDICHLSARQENYISLRQFSGSGTSGLGLGNITSLTIDAMEITKELVLKLYERKDSKRKRMLFELYRDLFTSSVSAKFLVDVINEKLSIQSVTLYDIKYIRTKMKKWGEKQMPVQKSEKLETQTQRKGIMNFQHSEPEPFVKPSKKY